MGKDTLLPAASQSLLDPKSSAASEITDLWWFMLIVSTLVVAIVIALVVLALLRRRDKPAGDESGVARLGGNRLIVTGGIVVPVVVLVALFAFTLETLVETAPGSSEPGLTVDVAGERWFWNVRYRGSAGAVTANEIHVPVGVPVRVRLSTEDVVHSFWVPQLNRKIDAIPGHPNELTFEARQPGVFRGQCAEFCGAQHANMAFRVIAQEPDHFAAYLRRIGSPAAVPDTPAETRGRAVFLSQGCAGCHTIRGTDAEGDVGPDLTHLASRETIAAATIPNRRGDLAGWILDPQHIKPGNRMPATDLDGDELQALLAYLESLE